MIYRTVLCLWLVLFLYPGGLLGQVYSDHKVRKYKITEKTTVEVTNKYGKVHVITWDKDSVKFEVDLRISANSDQKMQKLKDNISFDFTATKYYVVAKTQFSNQAGIISDFVDAFIPSNRVTINYLVYVPKKANLKIENKFGDIYMDDFAGNLEIILSNGDIKANTLAGSPKIRVSSGDGTINSIQNGKVFVAYSDLQIKSATNLNMDTKSSRITINKATNVRINSSRDKYHIEEIGELSMTAYFTMLNIDNLKKELYCEFKYGNIFVEKVYDSFSFINIESEYADIDLYFNRNTSYNLDITHSNDVYINLPASLARMQTKELDLPEKLKLTYGKIGSTATETSHKVNISAIKKCIVNIVHK
ncbi:MAG: hypothetical protein JXB24_06740 [Bacteroidales bacterium]|nr:hypothetical protein [Bacteroidales bacterium]